MSSPGEGRRGEILNLKWERVDLKEGFIRLRPEDTKTTEGRLVPLNRELMEMFTAMPRGFPQAPVFTYKGRSMAEMKRSFTTACQRARIEGFTFHDLRHTFNTNAYRAGVPIPTIMKNENNRAQGYSDVQALHDNFPGRLEGGSRENLTHGLQAKTVTIFTYIFTRQKKEGSA